MNPGGSVKDRAAYQMIRDAIRTGALKPGQTIIDSTSGNTGVAYSLIGGALGYPVTLVMPGNVSWARQQDHRRPSAPSWSSPTRWRAPTAPSACAARWWPRTRTRTSTPTSIRTRRTRWRTTTPPGARSGSRPRGRVTHFVTGIGTSGTVMGTGRRLKDYRRDIEVWAVEPDDALHGLEGLKHMASSLVPAIYQAGRARRRDRHADRGGLGRLRAAGQGRGAAGRPLVGRVALAGALRIAKRLAAAGKPGVVVTLFPDRADRYFEAPLGKQVPKR